MNVQREQLREQRRARQLAATQCAAPRRNPWRFTERQESRRPIDDRSI